MGSVHMDNVKKGYERSRGFLQEFREFIARGNVIDLAVAVVIGAAFGKIVTSLVNDIIMPPIGVLLGGVNFTDLFFTIKPLGQHFDTLADATAAKAVTINWGNFVNNIVDFVIIAFVIFLLVRTINKLKRQPPPKEPTEKACPYCATNIPIKAKRCPNCTSQLDQFKEPDAVKS